eukprot:COSAG02_NODE_6517_length_3523_cov_13.416472_2_plen_143_part_00
MGAHSPNARPEPLIRDADSEVVQSLKKDLLVVDLLVVVALLHQDEGIGLRHALHLRVQLSLIGLDGRSALTMLVIGLDIAELQVDVSLALLRAAKPVSYKIHRETRTAEKPGGRDERARKRGSDRPRQADVAADCSGWESRE